MVALAYNPGTGQVETWRSTGFPGKPAQPNQYASGSVRDFISNNKMEGDWGGDRCNLWSPHTCPHICTGTRVYMFTLHKTHGYKTECIEDWEKMRLMKRELGMPWWMLENHLAYRAGEEYDGPMSVGAFLSISCQKNVGRERILQGDHLWKWLFFIFTDRRIGSNGSRKKRSKLRMWWKSQ